MGRKATKNKAQKAALERANTVASTLAPDNPENLEVMKGLTDRQQAIVRLKIRGVSQTAMAQVLEVTPARISQEMKEIRAHFIAKGSSINQHVTVGETLSIYEEVEAKAWEVFFHDESKKLRALDTVMTAREKHVKLLMDLGLLKRAATQQEHHVVVSPLLRELNEQQKHDVVAKIITETHLKGGEEPEPPTEDDIIEAEYTEDNNEENETIHEDIERED